MCTGVTMHDGLGNWEGFHGDKVFFRLSLDMSLISTSLCLFIASIAFYSFLGERGIGDQELQT